MRLALPAVCFLLSQAIAVSTYGQSLESSLVEALKHGEPKAKIEAIGILLDRPRSAKEAVPLLAEALKDERRFSTTGGSVLYIARYAESALIAYGSDAVPIVEESLADPDQPACVRAAFVLNRIGLRRPTTAAALATAFKTTENDKVRAACISAYGVVEPDAEKLAKNIHEVLTKTADVKCYRAGIVIAGSRRITDESVVRQVADALTDTRAINYHRVGPIPVRLTAAESLGRIGAASGGAVGKLREMMLTDEDPGVRAAAAFAVFRVAMRDDSALDQLVEIALHPDRNSHDAVSAVSLLGEIGKDASPAADALRQICGWEQEETRWALVRYAAYRALAKVEGVGAVETLRTALKTESYSNRRAAADAIALLGPAARGAVPDLIHCLVEEGTGGMRIYSQESAARALGEIGPDAATAIPALEKFLSDNSNGWTAPISEALQKIKAVPKPSK